jgi:hypothetical protein
VEYIAAMTPEEIAQGQLDAYNAQDLDAYMAFFADDCVVADLNGPVTMNGAAEMRERYAAMFARYPHNRAELVQRIVVGETVIDHEDVAREPGGERFRVAAIYSIRSGKIARIDFVR